MFLCISMRVVDRVCKKKLELVSSAGSKGKISEIYFDRDPVRKKLRGSDDWIHKLQKD